MWEKCQIASGNVQIRVKTPKLPRASFNYTYERYHFFKAKNLNPLKHPSKQKFDGSSITAIQYLLHSFKRQRSEIHNL